MRYLIIFLLLTSVNCYAQNRTEVSLFMKGDSSSYLTDIGSESGDLFESLGHHGPAIENEWLALRLYFSEKASIDVYSKSNPGLELREARWYPTPEEQKDGWGADYYKVGSTVGLGGVRLWDGEKVVWLNPITRRFARVAKTDSTSFLEMVSEGIPYKGEKVDILVRVTVFSGIREARVEALALGDEPVQFVTGINYHEGLQIEKGKNYMATWGVHPEDVAVEKIKVGAAIIYNQKDYSKESDDGTQLLLFSKPTRHLETWITSANEKEHQLNTLDKLIGSIKKFRP